MDNQKNPSTPRRWVNLRLREEEHVELLEAEKSLHLNRSQLVRNMIREGLGGGPALRPEESRVPRELAYQIGAVGRNLNQLLKAIHSGKVVVVTDEFALIKAILDKTLAVEREMQVVIARSRKRSVIHGP